MFPWYPVLEGEGEGAWLDVRPSEKMARGGWRRSHMRGAGFRKSIAATRRGTCLVYVVRLREGGCVRVKGRFPAAEIFAEARGCWILGWGPARCRRS